MGLNVADAVSQIETSIREAGTPKRAESEKRYLKSDLTFLGATVWQTRAAVKVFARANPIDYDTLVALVTALWDADIFERRMAAVMLLDLHPKLLNADDLPLIEQLIRESLTWALVDFLAGDIAGGIRVADESVEATLD